MINFKHYELIISKSRVLIRFYSHFMKFFMIELVSLNQAEWFLKSDVTIRIVCIIDFTRTSLYHHMSKCNFMMSNIVLMGFMLYFIQVQMPIFAQWVTTVHLVLLTQNHVPKEPSTTEQAWRKRATAFPVWQVTTVLRSAWFQPVDHVMPGKLQTHQLNKKLKTVCVDRLVGKVAVVKPRTLYLLFGVYCSVSYRIVIFSNFQL